MVRLTLLLLLIASLSSTTAQLVLLDSSNCVHLRCEWRGEGRYCKSSNLLHRLEQKKTIKNASPINYPRNDDETDTDILERIRSSFPLNTFTLVNDDVDVGEKCKGRSLWCTGSRVWIPEHADSPKFIC